MGQKQSIPDVVFQFKLNAKQLNRMSINAEKQERQEKEKIKKAIEKGNLDGARIFAQNAIRKKHEALSYLRLSSKMDAVASRLEAAQKTQALTAGMGRVVGLMSSAMESMNVEQISTTMEQFEKQFEDLDVRSEYVSNAVDQTTSLSTPSDQVEGLIQQVADEHGLQMSSVLDEASVGTQPLKAGAQKQKAGDDLQERLNKLKNPNN
eukprot:GILJ01001106.1.p1 GENE.GILJ01001106.1~~GILJ01001106.1.p1  ORF type:complete len:207 (+),score=39.12 GILJ01001106.1:154-774(+)